MRISANSPKLREIMLKAASYFGHPLHVEFAETPHGAYVDSESGKIIIDKDMPINQKVTELIFETINAKNIPNILKSIELRPLHIALPSTVNSTTPIDNFAKIILWGGIQKDPGNLDELIDIALNHPNLHDHIQQEAHKLLRTGVTPSNNELNKSFKEAKNNFKKEIKKSAEVNPESAHLILNSLLPENLLKMATQAALRVESVEYSSLKDHVSIFMEVRNNSKHNRDETYKSGAFSASTIDAMDYHGKDIREYLASGKTMKEIELDSLQEQAEIGHTYEYLIHALSEHLLP